MSIRVDIDYKSNTEALTLPVSFESHVEANLTSLREEITLGVSNFPSFIQSVLEANLALVKADMALNMISQRLIINTDPLLITDMDNMILGELNIGQDKIFYSI